MTDTQRNPEINAFLRDALINPPEDGIGIDQADEMISMAMRKAVLAACDVAGSQIPQVSVQHIQALDAVRQVALKAWMTDETQGTSAASNPGR